MNSKEIVREIMATKKINNADMANALQITPAALWDRLKTKKRIKGVEVNTLNISVDKLNDMLRFLGYELVVLPCGEANKIEEAYLIDDTEDKPTRPSFITKDGKMKLT